MAYDEGLAERIRDHLIGRAGVTDKEMFGGVCFLLHGKMFVGVVKDELMVRVGKARHEEAIARPHARTMDFTKRPMKGYVFVSPQGLRRDSQLGEWVEWGADEVAGLTGKPGASTNTKPESAAPRARARRKSRVSLVAPPVGKRRRGK